MLNIFNHLTMIIFTFSVGVLGYFFGYLLHMMSSFFLQQTAPAHKIQVKYRHLFQFTTSTLFFFTALYFHCSWIMLLYLILFSGLVILSAIDIVCYMLPDVLTATLMWLGLLTSTYHLSIPLEAAVLGCVFGYLSLRVLGALFKHLRHIEGIGRGDCKLLAALGAWCGVTALPMILFIASCSGLLVGLFLYLYKKRDYTMPMPFGPFLALGGLIVLLLRAVPLK